MPLPNPQATVDATATFYLNQGVLGATCVLLLILLGIFGVVIWILHRENKALNGQLLSFTERLIEALNKVASGDERDRELLAAMKATLETRTQALGDLSNQVALSAQETRHGFAQISQALASTVELVRSVRDLVASLCGGRKGGGS